MKINPNIIRKFEPFYRIPSFQEAVDAIDEDIIIVKHTKLLHGVSKELTRMRVSFFIRFVVSMFFPWIEIYSLIYIPG